MKVSRYSGTNSLIITPYTVHLSDAEPVQGARRMHPIPGEHLFVLCAYSVQKLMRNLATRLETTKCVGIPGLLSDKVNNEPLIGHYGEKKGYDNLPDNQDRAANHINPTDRLWREGIGN